MHGKSYTTAKQKNPFRFVFSSSSSSETLYTTNEERRGERKRQMKKKKQSGVTKWNYFLVIFLLLNVFCVSIFCFLQTNWIPNGKKSIWRYESCIDNVEWNLSNKSRKKLTLRWLLFILNWIVMRFVPLTFCGATTYWDYFEFAYAQYITRALNVSWHD